MKRHVGMFHQFQGNSEGKRGKSWGQCRSIGVEETRLC